MSNRPDSQIRQSRLEAITRWIRGTGYPLEFYVADIFTKAGFTVTQAYHVMDVNHQKPKEIDVIASIEKDGMKVVFIIECKHARNPWVVFSSRGNKLQIDRSRYIQATIGTPEGQARIAALTENTEVQNLAMFKGFERSGFLAKQSFEGDQATSKGQADKGQPPNGKPDKSQPTKAQFDRSQNDRKHAREDLPYDAIQSVSDNAINLATQSERANTDSCILFFPVIVIDGSLFECFYESDHQDIKVLECGNMQIHWRGNSHRHLFNIDVVAKSELAAFASARLREASILLDKMSQLTIARGGLDYFGVK